MPRELHIGFSEEGAAQNKKIIHEVK